LRRTRASLAFIAIAIAGALVLATPGDVFGAFTSSTTNPGVSMGSASLAGATDLDVEIDCLLVGILRPVAELTWTPSASAWAEGYRIERWNGGVLENTATVTGQTTDAFTDGLGLLHLNLNTTYTWRVRAIAGSWQSPEVSAGATTPVVCL
jgi:hypothetical protein